MGQKDHEGPLALLSPSLVLAWPEHKRHRWAGQPSLDADPSLHIDLSLDTKPFIRSGPEFL